MRLSGEPIPPGGEQSTLSDDCLRTLPVSEASGGEAVMEVNCTPPSSRNIRSPKPGRAGLTMESELSMEEDCRR